MLGERPGPFDNNRLTLGHYRKAKDSGMRRYVIIAAALLAVCVPARSQSQEEDLIRKMSNDELAEYFMVKECSATLYVVCTDKEKVKARYNTPEPHGWSVPFSSLSSPLELEQLI